MENISLQVGTVLKGSTDYRIEEQLHRGGFGITYRASGTYMAGNIPQVGTFTIKEFFISKICSRDAAGNVTVDAEHKETYNTAKLDFKHEANILHNLHHDNIVPVNEVFEQNNTVYYVMSFLGNTSLCDYVDSRGGRLAESEAKDIMLSVSKAVKHLHDNQILHLDIKPENIMMQQVGGKHRPVLIDFGQAMYFTGGKLMNPKGVKGYTRGYSALEQKDDIKSFQPALDVYSLGATLLYMLSGADPCDASEQGRSKIFQVLPDSVSNTYADILIHALARNANERTPDVATFISSLREGQAPNPGGGKAPGRKITDPILPGKPGGGIPTKYITIALGVIAVIAIVFAGSKLLSGGSSPSTPTPPDSTAINQNDSVKKDSVKDEAGDDSSKKTVKDDKDSKTNETTTNPTPTPTPKPDPVPEKTSGTVSLGYGTWTGGLKNGKPNGQGTIRFTSSHSISGCSSMAESGDYADAYFENGQLMHGKLHKTNGETESFIR